MASATKSTSTRHRNRLWTAWTRLPLTVAARVSADEERQALHDRSARAGTVDAVRGLGLVRRTRRPVPESVARQWHALERVAPRLPTFGARHPGAPGAT